MPLAASRSRSASGCGVRTRTGRSAPAVRAARVDWVTRRPRSMITTWSTVWATSASRWLETSTVRPSSARPADRPRSQWTPSGSRPLAGSSRIRTSGSPSRAAASPRRWRMPSEKPPTRRRPAAASPTCSSDLVGAAAGRARPRRRGPGGGRGPAAGVEAARLQHGADLAGRVGELAVGPAVDGGGAGGRGDQAEQHAQGGRLAGAVGAEEAGDRPLVDLEVEVVDGEHVAEALGEPVHADRGHGVSFLSR